MPQAEAQNTSQNPNPTNTSGYTTEDEKPKEESEQKLDDYGYENEPSKQGGDDDGEKTPEKEAEPKEEKPEKKEETEEEGDKNATGYGEEPKKPEEPEGDPDDKKKADADGKGEEDYGLLDTGDLLPEEVKEIREFAKERKLSKHAVKAIVDLKKKEVADLKAFEDKRKKELQQKAQQLRSEWFNELKNDPDFGGENFNKNVKKAEKVVDEHLPNVKKKLTESGNMLPPYIMRDLAKLADTLNGTERLARGGPVTPEKKEDESEENDPLAFYG